MKPQTFVSYYRVSTDRQGRDGNGIAAQQEAIRTYLGSGRKPLASFVEVESGTNNARPQLSEALAMCRMTGATLIVGKVDRLARNTRFLLSIVEGSGDGGVVCCDLPQIPPGPVGKFILTQMAAVAELEAGLVSTRTKAALAAVKARGRKLGGWRGGPKVDPEAGRAARSREAEEFAQRLKPIVVPMRQRGLSLRQIGTELAERGVQTPNGGKWSADAVSRLLTRLEMPVAGTAA